MLVGTIELVLSILVAVFIGVKMTKSIKNYKNIWFGVAGLVSLLSTILAVIVFLEILEIDLKIWWVRSFRAVVSGYLPAAIFMVVMYTGALAKYSKVSKKLRSIRTELSIIGVILYLPHTVLYSVFSAPYGIGQILNGQVDIFIQLMTWTGLINAVLLFVLGFTSLTKVRSKLGEKKCKTIQKWSYLFYFNCFIHYMTLSIRGDHFERTLIYVFIYGIYLYLKVNYMLNHIKKNNIVYA